MRDRSTSSLLFRALAAGISLAACAPLTAYRSTGLVPAARPIAWDGVPAEADALRADLSLSHADIAPNLFPQEHDTALFIPSTTLDGSIGFAPVRGLELGVHGSYAAYQWSEPTADGTLPLPAHSPTWGIGPEIRGAFHPMSDEHFALGAVVNAMYYQVPYAEWQKAACTPAGDASGCVTATGYSNNSDQVSATYQLLNDGTTGLWAFSFGVYPSYSFGDQGKFGTVTLNLSAHTNFANDGFDDQLPQNGGKPYASGLIPMVGAGYSLRLDKFSVGLMAYLPLASNQAEVHELPGAMLTVGFEIGRNTLAVR